MYLPPPSDFGAQQRDRQQKVIHVKSCHWQRVTIKISELSETAPRTPLFFVIA